MTALVDHQSQVQPPDTSAQPDANYFHCPRTSSTCSSPSQSPVCNNFIGMNRAEDCVPASRHDPSTASISDLARKFGAQSLQSRQRQQCAVPSPINENFAHQPNQPFSKSQGLFHTLDPFSNHTHHAPLSPPLDRSEPISPLEMTATTKPRPIPVPASDRPSSASDDTTASSPPPSVFSQTSYFASSHSSPTQTRPGSSASVESVPYSSASDHGIRRHRQRILRRQTSNSHLAEVRALITRMVDNGDMCEVTAGSRGTSPCPSRPSEDNTERGEEADTMDLDEDFASRPTTCSSRSNSDASNMSSLRYRRSSDCTSDRGSLSSMMKEPRIRKRARARSRARRR